MPGQLLGVGFANLCYLTLPMRFIKASLLGGLLLLVWPALADADLRSQVAALAERHGFVVKGLDQLADEPAKPVQGDLLKQVERLLDRYDYILFHDAGGGIAELYIRNQKAAPPPKRAEQYRIDTRRRGRHHLVSADLVGPGSESLRVSLIVDTGASTIVLPSSAMARLGFVRSDLKRGLALTANGRVSTWRGTLVSVGIGDAVAEDVAVTFIADSRLGGRPCSA